MFNGPNVAERMIPTPGDLCDLFLARRAPRWRIEAGFGDAKLIRKLGDVLEDNLSAQ